MPVVYDFRDGVLRVTAIGDYLTAELTAALQAAVSDRRFHPGLPLLLDARSSLTVLSSDEVTRRAQWLASLPEKFGNVALVSSPAPTAFPIYRTKIQTRAVDLL